jgi:hypothetical protein
MGTRCLGIYSYTKVLDRRGGLPCVVALFPMKVVSMSDDFPERRQRQRKWFSLRRAAAKVDEPELRELFLGFDPAEHFH